MRASVQIVLVGIAVTTLLGCLKIDKSHKGNFLRETGSRTDIFATANTYFSLGSEEEERFAVAGKIVVSEEGWLSLKCGEIALPFSPLVAIPSDAESFWLDHVGNVLIRQPGVPDAITVGQIQCNRFNSGRRISKELAGIFKSNVAPDKNYFGEHWSAFVVHGWEIQSD